MFRHILTQLSQLKAAVIPMPLCLVMLATVTTAHLAHAQQPQIPTLQVCNQSLVQGSGTVKILARADATHTGTFAVQVNVQCTTSGYPAGSLVISGISMNDSAVEGVVVATASNFEQLTTTGTRTPTAYLSGRCTVDAPIQVQGCRYWIMFANNSNEPFGVGGTPDVVSFLVVNGLGQRIAYGTGPVVSGRINVAPTSF